MAMRLALKRLAIALAGAVCLLGTPLLTAPASADAVGGGCSPEVTTNFWGAFETTHRGCTTPRADNRLVLELHLKVSTPAPKRMRDCAVVGRVFYDNGEVESRRSICPPTRNGAVVSHREVPTLPGCHYYYVEWYTYVVFDEVAYYGQLTAGGHQYICR